MEPPSHQSRCQDTVGVNRHLFGCVCGRGLAVCVSADGGPSPVAPPQLPLVIDMLARTSLALFGVNGRGGAKAGW